MAWGFRYNSVPNIVTYPVRKEPPMNYADLAMDIRGSFIRLKEMIDKGKAIGLYISLEEEITPADKMHYERGLGYPYSRYLKLDQLKLIISRTETF